MKHISEIKPGDILKFTITPKNPFGALEVQTIAFTVVRNGLFNSIIFDYISISIQNQETEYDDVDTLPNLKNFNVGKFLDSIKSSMDGISDQGILGILKPVVQTLMDKLSAFKT